MSAHGDFCQEPQGMAEIVTDYFTNLFTSNGHLTDDMLVVLDCVPTKVTAQMNQSLCAPFTEAEVQKALLDIHPDKSPGPDGMLAIFYQKFWHVIGKEVTSAVLDVLNHDANREGWNHTVITLIPKTENPLLMKEFRPISLCNVCYKIVSRALTNRLRPYMGSLIDEY